MLPSIAYRAQGDNSDSQFTERSLAERFANGGTDVA
jgi:hypothetical protein